MRDCKQCGSYAINPGRHGRDDCSNLDLCDVCYWRLRANSDQDAKRYRFLRRFAYRTARNGGSVGVRCVRFKAKQDHDWPDQTAFDDLDAVIDREIKQEELE